MNDDRLRKTRSALSISLETFKTQMFDTTSISQLISVTVHTFHYYTSLFTAKTVSLRRLGTVLRIGYLALAT